MLYALHMMTKSGDPGTKAPGEGNARKEERRRDRERKFVSKDGDAGCLGADQFI